MEFIPDHLGTQGSFSKWELVARNSFDLKELYVRLHDFLYDEGYTSLTSNDDNFETFYYEKEDESGSKDHKIWWRASKEARLSPNKNFKFYIQLDMKTVGMKKVEQVVDGQKVELDKGEFELKFNIFIDFKNNAADANAFKNHWFLKLFRNLVENRWNREAKDQAFAEAMKFSNDLYQLIQIYTGVRPQPGNQPRDRVNIRGV